MNSFIIGLLLVAAPLAFAAFLLFFMMSGKGTTPLKEVKEVKEGEGEKELKEEEGELKGVKE